MKRVLKIIAVVLLVLVLGIAGLMVSLFSGLAPVEDGAMLASFARTIKDGYVSSYMFDTGEGSVALIDAGNDKAGKAILAELTRRGLKESQVSAIFLTHGHPDHIGAVPLFPSAQIYALESELPLLEGRVAANGFLPHLMGPNKIATQVTRGLKDGETVQVGSVSVQVFAVPGHTVGSAVYLANGVLFLGDSADMRANGKMVGAKGVFSDDEALNHASLKALAQRLQPRAADIHALAPAHSGPTLSLQPLLDFAAAQ